MGFIQYWSLSSHYTRKSIIIIITTTIVITIIIIIIIIIIIVVVLMNDRNIFCRVYHLLTVLTNTSISARNYYHED